MSYVGGDRTVGGDRQSLVERSAGGSTKHDCFFSLGTLQSRCVGYLQESKGTVCIAMTVKYPSPAVVSTRGGIVCR